MEVAEAPAGADTAATSCLCCPVAEQRQAHQAAHSCGIYRQFRLADQPCQYRIYKTAVPRMIELAQASGQVVETTRIRRRFGTNNYSRHYMAILTCRYSMLSGETEVITSDGNLVMSSFYRRRRLSVSDLMGWKLAVIHHDDLRTSIPVENVLRI